MIGEKHLFALYYTQASAVSLRAGQRFCIEDSALAMRMYAILRLSPGEGVILFDAQWVLQVVCVSLSKKEVTVELCSWKNNLPLTPTIDLIVPLLKKAALEELVYAAVEMGANRIVLVTTIKVARKWGGEHELHRLQHIAIAAAEQSKNFSIPRIEAPCQLTKDLLDRVKSKGSALFFDPTGSAAYTIFSDHSMRLADKVTLLVGPEADLHHEEKQLAVDAGFMFCALTPTVLRAQQAMALGLGLARSLLRQKDFV